MNSNVVKGAYNACYIDNQNNSGNYVELQPVNMPNLNFSFDIWFYIEGISKDIVSQDKGFSLGIENGKILFTHPDFGQNIICSEHFIIKKKEWNNIFVVYDGNTLNFAVNGVSSGNLEWKNKSILTNHAIRIGGGFCGYIRSYRLYSESISDVDFKRYLFEVNYDDKSMPNIATFIDFTDPSFPDLSPNKVMVSIHGKCLSINCVQTYKPSIGKYACVEHGKHINPIAFSSGVFSIYAKVFMRPHNQDILQVIYSSGLIDSESGFYLYSTTRSDSSMQLSVSIGTGRAVGLSGVINPNTWVDAIVIFDGIHLFGMVNGNLIENKSNVTFRIIPEQGDFRIGGSTSVAGKIYYCDHYIHTIAIFDKILSMDDAYSFLENHPFIFEENLIALFSFDSGAPVEYVTLQKITVDLDDIQIARGTCQDISQEAYKYRLNCKMNDVSESSIWKATIGYDAIVRFYQEYFGLIPTVDGIPVNFLKNIDSMKNFQATAYSYIINRLASNSYFLHEIEPLLYNELTEEVTSEVISSLSEQMTQSITRMILPAGASSSAATTASAAASSAGSSSIPIIIGIVVLSASLVAAGVAVVVDAIAETNDKINEDRNKKPEEDDDDNDDKGTITAKIEELSFMHDPDNYKESAVRCRNCDGPIQAPEWSVVNKSTATMLYIADQIETVKIKAKIHIKDTNHPSPPTVSIRLEAYNVSNCEYIAFNHFEYIGSLAPNNTHEIILSANDINIPKKKFKISELELYWNYEINGKTSTLPNTKCKIYIIPTMPAFPLHVDEGNDKTWVNTDFLSFISKGDGKSSEPANITFNDPIYSADDLKNITMYIYGHPMLYYKSGSNPFIDIGKSVSPPITTTLILRLNELISTLNGSDPVGIECTSFAAILSYYFSLAGIESEVVFISYYGAETHNEQKLYTNEIIPSKDKKSDFHKFDYHYIVQVNAQKVYQADEPHVFDASCVDAYGVPFACQPFSLIEGKKVSPDELDTYRGRFFKAGTFASIGYTTISLPLNPVFLVVDLG